MPAAGKQDGRQDQLQHLTGARCLAALWIVCAHYLPKLPEGSGPSFNGAVFRVNVAVCFFVIVSGFVTHYAYGARDLAGFWGLAQFYARRLGRVVFTFWVAMAFSVYILTRTGTHWEAWYLVRCALFIEQWVSWCPNGPSWFVFALLPSWILYPLTRRVVVNAEERYGGAGLVSLLLGLWAISFGPAICLLAVDGGISMQQHSDMTFWPPAQMADFAIGMTAAALVRRRMKDSGSFEMRNGLLADGSLLLIVLVVFLVPRPSTTFALHLNAWEPLLDHGLALPIAAFLVGSCSRGQPEGLGAKLLAHRALASLGEMSFEVYIFQRPMHDAFGLFFDTCSWCTSSSSGSLRELTTSMFRHLWMHVSALAPQTGRLGVLAWPTCPTKQPSSRRHRTMVQCRLATATPWSDVW
eukprot:gb/GFBE01017939.1/.p1 GENE.gb/GFBE01017939.1/~~gb/GFBE01017939.1/.p1  ORF type:complete len:410 (+),score=38.16 gb/GFBE01017939.1/:1-1230(+)